MAFFGQGTINVTTPTGAVTVPVSEFKTWVLGSDLGPVIVPDVAAYGVLPTNSGRVHVIPDLTSTCTLTLPAAAAGLTYKFWYGGAAADAQNWIISTGSASNYYVGGGLIIDSDAGAAADECIPVFSNNTSNAKLTVTTPQCGTRVEVWCNGTLWYVNAVGVSASATNLAFADLP